MLASASLPLIYDSTEVEGEKYIDGGIADNTLISKHRHKFKKLFLFFRPFWS